MKALISYAAGDVDDAGFARLLARELQRRKIETFVTHWHVAPGANILEKINDLVATVDWAFVIISRSYATWPRSGQELSAFLLHEIAAKRKVVVPIYIDDTEILQPLADRNSLRIKSRTEGEVRVIVDNILRTGTRSSPLVNTRDYRATVPRPPHDDIEPLRAALRAGRLTLVCGAGVSIDAGVPTWEALLNMLLIKLFERKEQPLTSEAVGLYQRELAASPLILARHLRRGLGDDFQRHVRDLLYSDSLRISPIIDAITELCRPQRNGKPLHSIITFNFDDLIEKSLQKNRIRACAIFKEGQTDSPSEMPIYHVHGYLPRDADPDPEQQLVFSEEVYHEQFIDPFSWSNLTLLSHLGQNTCLFVGLSMTDPNLRRLLDVSRRKNPRRQTSHFVIKKRRAPKDVKLRMERFTGDRAETARTLATMADTIDEGDAQSLGLNVLWIDDFREILDHLSRLH